MKTNNDDFYNEMTDSAEGDEQSYATGKKGKPNPKAALAKAQKENASISKTLAKPLPDEKKHMGTGAKVGIGIGAAVLIGTIIFFVWRHFHKHHKK